MHALCERSRCYSFRQADETAIVLNMAFELPNLREQLSDAVAYYWRMRKQQTLRQSSSGRSDQGARSAVTGGAQMDGVLKLLARLVIEAGIPEDCIFYKKTLELPGFFRPTKEWDLLVVRDQQLLVALEAKSQVGPSFGNNFNNRTEEAMGSALDLWTAFREKAFNRTVKPWLGYLFLLEECGHSTRPVSTREPHFPVFPEFVNASYAQRYELFCRKLVRELHYSSAAFLMSDQEQGIQGYYREPAEDLGFSLFAKSLVAHVTVYGQKQ